MSKRIKSLYNRQIDRVGMIKSALNMNIVTCGNCGSVIVIFNREKEHKCYDCGFQSEPCDFPDLFY